MQFNEDTPEAIGDVQIVAGGTSALAQREVQSQRLLTYLQITANPVLAPYTNLRYVLGELATSLDLDKDRAVNDPELTKLYMELMQQMQGAQGGQQDPMGPPQQPNAGGGGQPQQPPAPAEGGGATGLKGGELGVSPSPAAR